MDTVSGFMVPLKIQNNMQCEYICQKVQELVNKFQRAGGNLSDSFIVMTIKTVSQNDDSSIPELEFHN
jgi:CobQ-like glutamine amidotransferase family enzyme